MNLLFPKISASALSSVNFDKFPQALRNFIFFLIILSGALSSTLQAAQIVVSPTGNDMTGDGTEAHPFAGLERARDVARTAIRQGTAVEIILHGGTYQLKTPLVLGPLDSGTERAPVVWHAAPGEEVRLSGGALITGWKPVTDQSILTRLDLSVASRVLQVDLKQNGIMDYGEMGGGGFSFRNEVPGLELFVNDIPMQIARYPNHGFIEITETLGSNVVQSKDNLIKKGPTAPKVEGIIRVTDPHIARWAGESDPRVFGYWGKDWADEREKIDSIDPQKLVLTLAQPWHRYGYAKGKYFYGFNLLCEIDEPGEWYLDRKTGLLYLLPPGGVTPQRAMVSMLPSIVEINNAAHLTLQNLVFEGSRKTGVTISNSDSCRLVGCTIRNLGDWGIHVQGHACTIEQCSIYGVGNGGISLDGGDRKTLTSSGHLVENCAIHDYARWGRTYQPGIRINGVGCHIAHNHIYNAPHQGMNFAGNDHLIEFNEINNVCQEACDVGAIYAWNDWAGRGNRVSYNYFHDIMGYQGKGANGVYMDDCFSSVTILGNVFQRVKRAIHLGGGHDHQVINNLFVSCPLAIHADARGLNWRAYGFP